MAEKSKKGGAGKFFLGAVIGGLAGLIAGRQLKTDTAAKAPAKKAAAKKSTSTSKAKTTKK